MIQVLKPYPTMKNSGVKWLGEVPEHWELRRLRNVAECAFSGIDKDIRSGEEEVCFIGTETVYGTSRIYPTTPLIRITATQAEIKRFRLIKGDVLITKDSVVPTRIAIPALVREDLSELTVCGYHLGMLRPRLGIDSSFLFWTLRSSRYADYFVSEARGTTIIGLSFSVVASAPVLVPPLPEQNAIVRYLDYVDRRVQRLTRTKRKLVALLTEQKRAIIHRAITSGLNSGMSIKDAGIEWLEKIPEHWETASIKRHYSIQLGKMLQNHPESPADAEVAYLKAQHVQWFSVRTSPRIKMWASPRDVAQFDIAEGDLLVCEGGEGGRSGIVGEISSKFIIQNALHRVRPRNKSKSLNEYLQYLMSVLSSIEWFDAISNKATIAHFTREKFGALNIPLPPLPEQIAIVEYLDRATADIDAAIARANREIELLDEYRTRLIADVVTGKLDVREAAASLPEVDPLEMEEESL